jgi:hypothetical protein
METFRKQPQTQYNPVQPMDEQVVALQTADSVCTRATANLAAGHIAGIRTLEIMLARMTIRDWPSRTEVN